MASSQINKSSHHARSISLPSTPHPITAQFEEQFCRLRSSQTASTSSSSSLTRKLTGLTELYGLVDELLQLPSNHQSISQIQAMLDGSLRLLDTCSTIRDVLLQSKERLQDMQSALRRRCSGELTITREVAEYLKTRKTIKKVVKKCLKNIIVPGKSDEISAPEYFLNDVEEITVDIFTTLLSYIGGSKSQSRTSWTLVSKLIHKSSEKEAQNREFDAFDVTLESLVSQKKTGVSIENIRNQMMSLEYQIQEFEEVLECLFRHLVKTRATMLNNISY